MGLILCVKHGCTGEVGVAAGELGPNTPRLLPPHPGTLALGTAVQWVSIPCLTDASPLSYTLTSATKPAVSALQFPLLCP